ncbi:MAG: c-type cytochrome, partial [Myxococcales bacterium]|nr:c-type cytochrome [Myxococcales bacterium]
ILGASYEVSGATLPDGDPVRGRHLVENVTLCAECHGSDFSGMVVEDAPMFGRLSAPNITPAGVVSEYTVADWDRSLRHGVTPDGRGLVFMPSEGYASLSDQDAADVVAYLRTVSPVENVAPTTELGLIGRQLAAFGAIHIPAREIDHAAVGSNPVPGPTAEYGAYLVNISGCTGCHGSQLEGQQMGPDDPVAPAINASVNGSWTFEQFDGAVRHGVGIDGRQLAAIMPSRGFAGMSDDEVRALFLHIHTP